MIGFSSSSDVKRMNRVVFARFVQSARESRRKAFINENPHA